jgi:hypothetical protein
MIVLTVLSTYHPIAPGKGRVKEKDVHQQIHDISGLETAIRLQRGTEYQLAPGQEFQGMGAELRVSHIPLGRACGASFEATPRQLIETSFRCPGCDPMNEEYGTDIIRGVLDEAGVGYTEGAFFEGLVGEDGGDLGFDFEVEIPGREDPLYIAFAPSYCFINHDRMTQDYQTLRGFAFEYEMDFLEFTYQQEPAGIRKELQEELAKRLTPAQ